MGGEFESNGGAASSSELVGPARSRITPQIVFPKGAGGIEPMGNDIRRLPSSLDGEAEKMGK